MGLETVGGDGSEAGTVTEEEGKHKQNRRRITMPAPPRNSVTKRRATSTFIACTTLISGSYYLLKLFHLSVCVNCPESRST